MAFLKKMFGGKSAKDTACNLAKQVGLDPKVIMPKIFAYFCGGQKDASGKPAMDFSSLMGFVQKTGIMSGKGGSGINPGMLGGIFKSVMGGGDQGDDDKGNPKGTLNFDEFEKGMTKVAEEKYKDEGIKGDKALSKLEQQIIDDNDVSDWIE